MRKKGKEERSDAKNFEEIRWTTCLDVPTRAYTSLLLYTQNRFAKKKETSSTFSDNENTNVRHMLVPTLE